LQRTENPEADMPRQESARPPGPAGGIWDPFGTLRGALWIGGGQWAGKSTVARILARRYGITAYHYDYHDARGHDDRRLARDRLIAAGHFRPYLPPPEPHGG
jgi:hypothetical protein